MPYYEKAERFIGVTGTKEGIRSAPDGIFQPPAAPRVHEMLVAESRQTPRHPRHPRPSGDHHQDPPTAAPPCHYCGQCGRGCITASNYSSSQVQIFPAMKTGKLKIFPNAMARELITDGPGKVKAVSYIDKATRTEKQIRCRAVVVAASACESARLLLNSRGPGYTNGSRQLLGCSRPLPDGFRRLRRRADTCLRSKACPAMTRMVSAAATSICRGGGSDKKDKEFPRGYHVEIGGGYGMPGVSARSTEPANCTKATART